MEIPDDNSQKLEGDDLLSQMQNGEEIRPLPKRPLQQSNYLEIDPYDLTYPSVEESDTCKFKIAGW